MNGLVQTAGWAMLQWLLASTRDFLMAIGIPGLIVIVTGGILLASASFKALKFLQGGKGMSMTAAVMFAALAWMWLMMMPAGAKTRSTAPADLMAASGTASPILASKPAPVEPSPQPLAMLDTPIANPQPVQAVLELPTGYPLVAEALVPLLFLPQPAPILTTPVHEAKPAHAPAHHHTPAPAAKHTAHIERPTHPPVAGPRLNRAGGGSYQANHRYGGGHSMTYNGREAARQRNFAALGQMDNYIQKNMHQYTGGGSSHFGGHMSGHSGGHSGGMGHHTGHH